MRNKKESVLVDTRFYNSIIITYISCICSLFYFSVAFAAPSLSEMQAARASATKEYYQALTNLGPNATPEQQAQVRAKFLLPSQVKWANTINQSMAESVQKSRQNIYNILKSQWDMSVVGDEILHPTGNQGVKGSSSSESPASSSSGNEGNNIKLDSSKIPKEIIFPRPNQKTF